jgi:hypothetical protein
MTMDYKIGMIVKAYDFPTSDNHYLVGVVTEVRDYTIKCKALWRVWEGRLRDAEDEGIFETPKLGQAFNDRRERLSGRPRLAELTNPRSYAMN